MSLYTRKKSPTNASVSRNTSSRDQVDGQSTVQLLDNRPAARAQQELHEKINASSRIQSLNIFQEKQSGSPHVQQLWAYQDMADQANRNDAVSMMGKDSAKSPVQCKLKITSVANRSEFKEYTNANADEIDADVADEINRTGWSQAYKMVVIERLKALARSEKTTMSVGWRAALNEHGLKKAEDLMQIGIAPKELGKQFSDDKPFGYVADGPVKDHISDEFDEGRLPWTHNSSPMGLLGMMLTGVMAPGVEKSVNFRFDIDSRYHQGVTIVMKPGLYASMKAHGAWIEDLYSQHTALGKSDEQAVGGKAAKMRQVLPNYEEELFDALTDMSDFRSRQLAEPKGTLPSSAKVPIIACHNPQLRIPSVVEIEHIDFIIMTREAWAALTEALLNQEAFNAASLGASKFKERSSQKAKIPDPQSASAAMKNLRRLSKQGGIYVDGERVEWAHQAGRVGARGLAAQKALQAASQAGMESGKGFGSSPIQENNSPKALGMESFERFQQIYYAKLAERDNETGAVASEKLKGKLPIHLYKPEVQGLLHVNNCLINAICQAAHGRNANLDELTRIREALDNVGQMMAADEVTIDAIRQVLNIAGRGIWVRYPVDAVDVEDELHEGQNPITVYHTGADHFVHVKPVDVEYHE